MAAVDWTSSAAAVNGGIRDGFLYETTRLRWRNDRLIETRSVVLSNDCGDVGSGSQNAPSPPVVETEAVHSKCSHAAAILMNSVAVFRVNKRSLNGRNPSNTSISNEPVQFWLPSKSQRIFKDAQDLSSWIWWSICNQKNPTSDREKLQAKVAFNWICVQKKTGPRPDTLI